jgi:uncharacterized protein YbcI
MNSLETSYLQQDLALDGLEDRILEAWLEANGVSECEVDTFTRKDGLIILIQNAFTRAESLLAERRRTDNTLREYIKSLMKVIGEEQILAPGKVAGRRVDSFSTHISLNQGWVMWLIKLSDLRT